MKINAIKRLGGLSTKKGISSLFKKTHWSKDLETVIEAEWRGKIFFSHGTIRARGVAILFRDNFEIHVEHCMGDSEGRILIIKGHHNDFHFCFVNII